MRKDFKLSHGLSAFFFVLGMLMFIWLGLEFVPNVVACIEVKAKTTDTWSGYHKSTVDGKEVYTATAKIHFTEEECKVLGIDLSAYNAVVATGMFTPEKDLVVYVTFPVTVEEIQNFETAFDNKQSTEDFRATVWYRPKDVTNIVNRCIADGDWKPIELPCSYEVTLKIPVVQLVLGVAFIALCIVLRFTRAEAKKDKDISEPVDEL